MSSYSAMSTSSKASRHPTRSSTSPSKSDISASEQWSEVSSPCDSALPSRNSLSFDGEGMCLDQQDLAAFFVNVALANGEAATGGEGAADIDARTVSRAHCNPLMMPKNFAQVLPGVYRAHYPTVENYTFLRVLGIRTILTLVPEECTESYQAFMSQCGIQHFQIGIEPNKDPTVTIRPASMEAALRVISRKENHPILVHCNKGKHRTGCVIACLRKILGCDLDKVLQEYRHHAGHKARALDERYIEAFDEKTFQGMVQKPEASYSATASRMSSVPEPFKDSPLAKGATISTRLRG